MINVNVHTVEIGGDAPLEGLSGNGLVAVYGSDDLAVKAARAAVDTALATLNGVYGKGVFTVKDYTSDDGRYDHLFIIVDTVRNDAVFWYRVRTMPIISDGATMERLAQVLS